MKTPWQIWRAPLLVSALMLFGLLAALLGTGIWHWASWLAMAVPVLVTAYHTLKR
jgi:hypothetical protein